MAKRNPIRRVCPWCKEPFWLRRPGEVDTRKYCSRSCAGAGSGNWRKAIAVGVPASVKARQRRVLERVKHMTPLEAFRAGYLRGIESKYRQLNRHFKVRT